MITKEITIIGINEQKEPVEKTFILGYCYATEIGFKEMAGTELSAFIQEVIKGFNATPKIEPDKKTAIMAVVSSAMSYYEFKGEECPISDRDFMFSDDPEPLGAALGHIIVMYAQFYKIAGMVEEKKADKTTRRRKNA